MSPNCRPNDTTDKWGPAEIVTHFTPIGKQFVLLPCWHCLLFSEANGSFHYIAIMEPTGCFGGSMFSLLMKLRGQSCSFPPIVCHFQHLRLFYWIVVTQYFLFILTQSNRITEFPPASSIFDSCTDSINWHLLKVGRTFYSFIIFLFFRPSFLHTTRFILAKETK